MLQAYINGIAYRALSNFQIKEKAGNPTATTITVAVDDLSTQPIPVAGDVITFVDTDTSEILFFGQCGIPASNKFSTGHEALLYKIICSNGNAILGNRVINEAYQDKTVSYIVNDLYDKYIAEEGITLGAITNTDATFSVYTASDLNLQTALNELANSIGAVWQVSNEKVFSFVGFDDFPVFPHTINNSFLMGGNWQSKTKDYKTRTVQIISGGYAQTDLQVEDFTYLSTDTSAFSVSFPIVKQPSIYVNGVQVDDDVIGVIGLDDMNPNLVFRWSYNSTTMSYVTTTGYLSVGDVVEIQYYGQYPIRISVENDEKISEVAARTGTSGRREMVENDASIQSADQAFELAQSLLTQFEDATTEISWFLLSSQLYDLGMDLSDLSLYTVVNVDLPNIGISGEFIITDRTLTAAAGDMSDPAEKFRVDLVMKNRDYLQSYGEVISSIRRQMKRLSYRADEIVVQYKSFKETEALSEAFEYDANQLYFCTAELIEGSIFAPCDFGAAVYPGAAS